MIVENETDRHTTQLIRRPTASAKPPHKTSGVRAGAFDSVVVVLTVINTSANDQKQSVRIRRNDTIWSLKLQIQRVMEIDALNQRLFFGFTELSDERLVSSYFITHLSSIRVVTIIRPPSPTDPTTDSADGKAASNKAKKSSPAGSSGGGGGGAAAAKPKETFYEILGLKSEDAATITQSMIKDAYKTEAKIHHPDRGGDKERMVLIQTAYETLNDSHRRRKYDDDRKYKSEFRSVGVGGNDAGADTNHSDVDDGTGNVYSYVPESSFEFIPYRLPRPPLPSDAIRLEFTKYINEWETKSKSKAAAPKAQSASISAGGVTRGSTLDSKSTAGGGGGSGGSGGSSVIDFPESMCTTH